MLLRERGGVLFLPIEQFDDKSVENKIILRKKIESDVIK